MKYGTGIFLHESDEWATPQDVFQKLDDEFHFTLDPCATEQNHKCKKFYTAENSGLSAPWGGLLSSAIHPIARLASG